MKKIKKALLLALSLALSVTMFAACGFQSEASGTGSGNQTTDTGSSDTGSTDTGSSDTGSTDTGSTDAPCEHTGGTATCTAKAECELCGEEYGEFAAHDYTVVKYDDDSHWNECVCGAKDEESDVAHSGGTATCTAKAVCEVCEQAYGEFAAHDYTVVKYDDDSHWNECACGAKDEESDVAHSGGTATCTAKAVCEVCEQAYGEFAAHVWATELSKDEYGHWYDCTNPDCTCENEGEGHHGGTATCETQAVCDDCGYSYGELAVHTYAKQNYVYYNLMMVMGGGEWAMVTEDGKAFGTLNETYTYGYMPAVDVTLGMRQFTSAEKVSYTFTQCGPTSYTIQDAYGRYIYMKGTYNNFNVSETLPEEGGIWYVDTSEGLAKVTNATTNKWIQYDAQYGTFGAYDTQKGVNVNVCGFGDVVAIPDKFEGDQHWAECTVCGEATEKTAHTLAYAYENHQHWQECACGYKTEKVDCLYMSEDEETAMSCVKYDAEKHWIECVCGQELVMVDEGLTGPHWWDDCKDTVCDFCGYTREQQEHIPETVPGSEATCEVAGLTDGVKCSVCDAVLTAQEVIPAPGHTLTYAYENHQHWQECACGYETEKVDCLYMSEDEETAMSCVKYDAEKHWIQCICGQELVMVDEGLTGPHWWEDDYDSMCDFCGYTREIKITLEDAVIVEQVAGKFTLPADVLGNVQSVNIGEFAFTGINGKEVTIGANELVAQEEVGEGKTMIVVTDKATYTIPANVYTMIIDDKAELDQWQAVAAENAIKAGVCVEAQKGYVYTGYFVLNTNIEYNGVWTPYKTFGEIWGLYGSAAWVEAFASKEVKEKSADGNAILYTDGSINEDWGTGYYAGFKGVFDGNGHYINGMETSGDFAGFVVTMGGGTIKDVAFTNASIGANAGFVSNRGPGTIENVYVQVVSMGNGQNSDNPSSVITRHGNPGNVLNNILVDMSSINVATLKYACIANLASDPANGVYIIGGEGLGEPAQDFNESAAAKTFLHYNANSGNAGDYDVAGSFATAADLLADETHGAVVAAWAGDFWTVDAENGTVLPTALTTATPVRAAKIEASTGTVSVYSGDVTALGYAAGTTVYDYSAPGAAAWDNRVKIYTAGENVKTNVLRYDMVLSAIPTGAIVFWMDKGGATYVRTVNVNHQGAADWNGCYEEAKETTYGLTEADQKSQISIYEKETNVLVSMNGWKTNTVYTVELYHNGASNVTMGLSDSMHAYIANVEYISLDDSDPITASASSMILPSYTGDVTKLGFAAGTTIYTYGTPTADSQWGNTGATYGATQWWAMAISSIGVKQNADGTESIAIQFMLPELPDNQPLFVVWMMTKNNGTQLPQINQNSIQQTQAKYTVVTTDAEGNTPASVEAGKVYTMTITLTDTADDITGGHWSFVDYANNSVMYVAK